MKKAGIITFHCADNLGAVLQAYALMEIVNAFNMDIEIIDFRPNRIVQSYSPLLDIKYTLKYRGVLGTVKAFLIKVRDYKKNKLRNANFQDFRNKYLKISNKTYKTAQELLNDKPLYDYYITGSDQVWNPDFFLRIGESYFLDFAHEGSTKISYAASIARKPEHSQHKYYNKHLKGFNYISIREKSSKEFVKRFVDKKVYVTLDPTLLIDKKDWKRIATYTKKKEYILVYDLVKEPVIISVANKIAREYGYRIISYSKKRGYINWDSSFSLNNPTDFLGLIKNAKAVITSSFHGTAFAIIFNKPFYTIPHHRVGSRMIDLLDELKLNDRLIKDTDDLNIKGESIDYDSVNRKLEKLKLESITFLEAALGSKT